MNRAVVALTIAVLLAGCAGVPPEAGFEPVGEAVNQRVGYRLALSPVGEPDPWIETRLADPLDLAGAVQLALLNNPQLQAELSKLRLGAAEVREATQLDNPRLSIGVRESDEEGAANNIEVELLAPLVDLVLRRPRLRVAEGELLAIQAEVIGEVLELASEVESAWYGYLAAEHKLEIARLMHEAASVGSLLGQRFEQAGNLRPLDVALQADALGEAAAGLAGAERDRGIARGHLNALMGLEPGRAWDTGTPLALPAGTLPDRGTLRDQALTEHPSLLVAQREHDKLGLALSLERRFRGIADLDLGVSYERETDRSELLGPVLELSLPIFNQSQAEIAAAEARLREAGWSIQAARGRVLWELEEALATIEAAGRQIEIYRTQVIPAREQALELVMREYNYMLRGVFDVIEVREREFQAYDALVDAVAEYWLAAADLRRAVGGRLDLRSGEAIRLPDLGPGARQQQQTPAHQHHGAHDDHTP